MNQALRPECPPPARPFPRNDPRADGFAELTRLCGGGSWVTQATGTLAPYGTFVNGNNPTPTEYLVDLDCDQLTADALTNAGSTGVINDGVVSGNVTQSPGVLGQAVTLGGAAGDEVQAGPSPLAGAQERTVSVWARTTAASGIVTPLTLGTNGSGSKWDMDIDCANGGVIELGVGNGRTTGSGPALNDGQWHMMTAVLPAGANDISQVRLFVDGAFAYSNSGSRTINTGSGSIVVGRSANLPTTIQYFPGDVDDVVIWSEAFTDAQVQSLYDVATEASLGYAAGDFEQLLEVWRQNEAEATIAGRTWRRATGLTGGAGLTVRPNGSYELVFDVATGAGVATPAATFTTAGAGCPSLVGLPALSAPQLPALGGSLQIAMSNVSPTALPLMLAGYTSTPPFAIRSVGLTSDPTCLLTVSAVVVLGPLVTVGGSASMSLPIPPAVTLVGTVLEFQGAQLEVTTAEWCLSDRGTAVIGF